MKTKIHLAWILKTRNLPSARWAPLTGLVARVAVAGGQRLQRTFDRLRPVPVTLLNPLSRGTSAFDASPDGEDRKGQESRFEKARGHLDVGAAVVRSWPLERQITLLRVTLRAFSKRLPVNWSCVGFGGSPLSRVNVTRPPCTGTTPVASCRGEFWGGRIPRAAERW